MKDKNSKNKKKRPLTNPHDITFKKLFSKKEIAADVIIKNLPLEIVNIIDVNNMKLVNDSYVDNKLKESFADIVYEIKINEKKAYATLLFEHKSYTDKMTIFQVLTYIVGIWRRAMEEGKNELPIVIPIVIYHGKEKWNYRTDLRDLIPEYNNLPQCIKERMPVLKHDFININEHTEDDIDKYNPLAKMVIRSFKYIFADDDKLIKAFVISVDEASASMKNEELSKMVEILLIYFGAANRNLTEKNILSKIQDLEGKGEKIMTILEARELKGRREGKREGMREKEIEIAKISIKKGLPIDVISDITGLTLEEVKELMISGEE